MTEGMNIPNAERYDQSSRNMCQLGNGKTGLGFPVMIGQESILSNVTLKDPGPTGSTGT